MKLFGNMFSPNRPIIKANNSSNPFNYKYQNGLDCDIIPDTYGEFGKSPTNPIPVNGPNGIAIYFNNIRTKNNYPLIYHRLNSISIKGFEESVDPFEVVTPDGVFWDILYFHVYHPRNSNKCPADYIFSRYSKEFSEIPFGMGLTEGMYPSFPEGLESVLAKKPRPFNFLAETYLKMTKDTNFIRPQEHFIKLLQVSNVGAYFNKLTDFIAYRYPSKYFINLLKTPSIEARIAALMCIKKNETFENAMVLDICEFAYHNIDEQANDLCIDIIKKYDPDTNTIFQSMIDSLNTFNEDSVVKMSLLFIGPQYKSYKDKISTMSVDQHERNLVLSKTPIPYLKIIANNKSTSEAVKYNCNKLIDELHFGV